MELCAGGAQLSASLKVLGFQSLAYDHSKNRHHKHHAVLNLDLSKGSSWPILEDLIRHHSVCYVHLAPPCGTASRARDRPLSHKLKAAGVPEPKPLRSEAHPEGLPHLEGVDLERVRSANSIYVLAVKVANLCSDMNVLCSIENPATSYFWLFPGMNDLLSRGYSDVEFDGCMHGGSRDRLCKWRVLGHAFDPLKLKCDSTHEHKPWSMSKVDGKWVFPTAEEASYPKVLTDRVALLVLKALDLPLPFNLQMNFEADTVQAQAAQAGKQPRGNKLPPLVSEFKQVHEFKNWEPTEGFRVLREYQSRDGTTQNTTIAGEYRSPKEFITDALLAGHPMAQINSIDAEHTETITFLARTGPTGIVRHRIDCVKWLTRRTAELSSKEKSLHESMPLSVQNIMEGKNLLLFKELLHFTDFPDADALFDEMISGFRLTGKTTTSGCLSKKLKPSLLAEDDLKKQSVWNRKAVAGSCRSTGDVEADKALWAETLTERDKGWLRGPYDETQITSILGSSQWLCVRRFPLFQKTKLRIIDDCKEASLNQALATTEKLDLMGVDRYVNLAGSYYKSLMGSDKNEDWNKLKLRFVGRTLDLKAAYKQLACHPDSLWSSVLVAWNPEESGAKFFISDALMFGASASVYAFNRAARAIWHIATKWLRILALQFYDDFPCLEVESLSTSARFCFEALLKCLGWKVSESEDKCFPFSSVFKMLGVNAELTNLEMGRLVISNYESRITDIMDLLNGFIQTKKMGSAMAATTFGRLTFALSSCFGKGAAPGLRLLSRCSSSGQNMVLKEKELLQLELIRLFIQNLKPREIDFNAQDDAVLVFTDAAYENQRATYGVFIIMDGARWTAAGEVPESLLRNWTSQGIQQVITQAELYPVLLVRLALGEQLIHRKTVYYIDNDAARFGLIKADSPSSSCFSIIKAFYSVEVHYPSQPWFARVPTRSNVADAPSRGELFKCAEDHDAQIIFLHEQDEVAVDMLINSSAEAERG